MTQTADALQQNIRLYPAYQMASNFLPWLPLFFLYHTQYVSLANALAIGSVYYFSVFVLEIPSGYLSDRFGRRPILIAASTSAVIAYATFLLANNFQTLVIGQIFLAGFFALKSGADNALLYDSLQQLNRQDEYGEQEAKSAKLTLLSLAASGLIGGIAGFYNLHLAYALSLVAAIISLYLSTQFSEPEKTGETYAFVEQLKVCIGYLRRPLLLWIFGYFVVAYSLEHIPAEFNQPYIKLLQSNWFGLSDTSALVSGVVVSVSMFIGAIAASVSIRLQQALGIRWLLLGSLSLQTIIIATMAVVLHPLVLLAVMFRNSPTALTHAPMLDTIAPLIASAQRATYLSIQSLAGRLGFATLLFGLSKLSYLDDASAAGMSWSQLSFLLLLSLTFAIASLLVIYLASRRLRSV